MMTAPVTMISVSPGKTRSAVQCVPPWIGHRLLITDRYYYERKTSTLLFTIFGHANLPGFLAQGLNSVPIICEITKYL